MTPNSPEFAQLSTAEKLRILEARAIQAGTWRPPPDEEEDDDEPQNRWGDAAGEAAALKRWRSGEKTPATPMPEAAA